MNLLSRVWYQLTQARRSSVRGISPVDPIELQIERAVRGLTDLGFIARSNLNVQWQHKSTETGYVLEAMALQNAGITQQHDKEVVAVVAQSRLIGLWELAFTYSNFGVAAWLSRAGYFVPSETLVNLGLFKDPLQYLDQHPEIQPQITYLTGLVTTYRSFQVVTDQDGKTLEVSLQDKPTIVGDGIVDDTAAVQSGGIPFKVWEVKQIYPDGESSHESS